MASLQEQVQVIPVNQSNSQDVDLRTSFGMRTVASTLEAERFTARQETELAPFQLRFNGLTVQPKFPRATLENIEALKLEGDIRLDTRGTPIADRLHITFKDDGCKRNEAHLTMAELSFPA